MIVIEDKIISDCLLEEYFACNLDSCKGACCVAGDGGAPLETSELPILADIYEQVAPYLTEQGQAAIAEQGLYVYDQEAKLYATPLINGGACAYVTFDALGIAHCGIQKAFLNGDINWPKPVSCHLYPVRIDRFDTFEAVNYERWSICKPACKAGKAQKITVFEFVKDALIRKYGADFYAQLEAAAQYNKEQQADR